MSNLRFDLFRTDEAEVAWRWRLWSGSRIVAGSMQAYSRRIDAIKSAAVTMGLRPSDIVDGGEFRHYGDYEATVRFRFLDERAAT